MECTKCSVDGKELVFMTNLIYDSKTGKNKIECPKCGKEEIIGYGRI